MITPADRILGNLIQFFPIIIIVPIINGDKLDLISCYPIRFFDSISVIYLRVILIQFFRLLSQTCVLK